MKIVEEMKNNPVIAAVKDDESLKNALASKCKILFLIYGDICDIKDIVNTCHDAGKIVFLHIDLIKGFSKDKSGIIYIAKEFKPDGIITTKSSLIQVAKANGMEAVFRVFLVDSTSVETAIQNINYCQADLVEIMPGIIPSLFTLVGNVTKTNLISGGLVSTKEMVDLALSSGAIACSTSAQDLW